MLTVVKWILIAVPFVIYFVLKKKIKNSNEG